MPIRRQGFGPGELLSVDKDVVATVLRWDLAVHPRAFSVSPSSPGAKTLGVRWEVTVREMTVQLPDRVERAVSAEPGDWLEFWGEICHDGDTGYYRFNACQLDAARSADGGWCFVAHEPPEDLAGRFGLGA